MNNSSLSYFQNLKAVEAFEAECSSTLETQWSFCVCRKTLRVFEMIKLSR